MALNQTWTPWSYLETVWTQLDAAESYPRIPEIGYLVSVQGAGVGELHSCLQLLGHFKCMAHTYQYGDCLGADTTHNYDNLVLQFIN